MIEKLYNNDSFLKTFTAEIISSSIHDNQILTVLDRTCFYPEGGGQPSDIGIINGVKVSHVFEENGQIFHVTEKQLPVGDKISAEIDFERRFQYMQIHSAEHILSGYFQKYYGLNNVGFHIGKEFSTIDLDGYTEEKAIESAEHYVNDKIYKNIPVNSFFPTKEELKKISLRKEIEQKEDLRVVEIDDCDICACCGMHVKNTGEIGLLKIISAKHYKKGVRITFLCGIQAVQDYQKKHKIISDICTTFALSPDRLTDFISKYINDFSELKAENSKNKKKICALKIHELSEKIEIVNSIPLIFEEVEDMSLSEIRHIALELTSKKEVLAIILSNFNNGIIYVITKPQKINIDLTAICSLLNNEFEGKGGGDGKVCQGTLKLGSHSEIEAKIKSAL